MDKRIISALALFLVISAILCSLTGCFRAKPEKTVEAFMAALKNFDQAAVNECLTSDNQTSALSSFSDIETARLVFYNLGYEITETTVKDNSATVRLTVRNADMKNVMSKVLADAIGAAITGGLDADKYREMFAGYIKSDNVVKTEREVYVSLLYENDKWRIQGFEDSSAEFLAAITGGALEFLAYFK